MNGDGDRTDNEDEEVSIINRNVGVANGGVGSRNAGFVTPNFPGNGRAVGRGGRPRPVQSPLMPPLDEPTAGATQRPRLPPAVQPRQAAASRGTRTVRQPQVVGRPLITGEPLNQLHAAMQHVGQDPNASLHGHHPGPVNRQMGEAAFGPVTVRNTDAMYFLDDTTRRNNMFLQNLNQHRIARERSESVLNQGRQLEMVTRLLNENTGDQNIGTQGNISENATNQLTSVLENGVLLLADELQLEQEQRLLQMRDRRNRPNGQN